MEMHRICRAGWRRMAATPGTRIPRVASADRVDRVPAGAGLAEDLGQAGDRRVRRTRVQLRVARLRRLQALAGRVARPRCRLRLRQRPTTGL